MEQICQAQNHDISVYSSERSCLITDQWPIFHGYHPLDKSRRQIRLLQLAGSNSNTTLQYSLRQDCILDDEIKYYALSYYWGAPSAMETILVDGIEVQVRKTVFRFLRQLSYHFGSILLWLDALCINQKDVDERNSQVSMMADIYKSAAGVYTWLGEGDSDCEYAIDYAAQVDPLSSTEKEHEKNTIYEYFGYLLHRPYWTRIWVIQEVVLARQVWLFYGEKKITWESFTEAFKRLRQSLASEDSSITYEDWERVSQLMKTRDRRQKKWPDLVECIKIFQHSRCTDARDKIYGLRGIALGGDALRIDYAQSVVGAFFDALSLTRPSVEWARCESHRTYKSKITNSAFENSHTIQCCVQMEAYDFVHACHDMEHDRLIGCLRYIGTVLESTPIDDAEMEGVKVSGRYSAIALAKFPGQERAEFYGSQHVQIGDLVYTVGPLVLTFRKPDPHSKPIDQLFPVPNKPPPLVALRENCNPPIDIVSFEEGLGKTKGVLLAGLEVCGLSFPNPRTQQAEVDENNWYASEYHEWCAEMATNCDHWPQVQSDFLFVHLNRATLLAFMVHHTQTSISEFNSRHPSLFESVFRKSPTPCPTLCKCLAGIEDFPEPQRAGEEVDHTHERNVKP